MLSTLDRYLLRLALGRFLGLTAIIVLILALEDLPRILDRLQSVGARADFIQGTILNLLPEFTATAMPLALFFALAFQYRQLTFRGELDALLASGLGPARLLRMPLLLAAATAILVTLLDLTLAPMGERNLDHMTQTALSGGFGLAMEPGQPTQISRGATLYFDSADSVRDTVYGLVLNRDGYTVLAQSARLRWVSANHLSLALRNGFTTWNSENGPKAARFGTYRLEVHVQGRRTSAPKPLSDRLLRLGYADLLKAAQGRDPAVAPPAGLASLSSRVSSAVFCLLIPLLALSLSVPARRSRSAIGVGVGMIVIVGFWRLNSLAEQMLVGRAPAGQMVLLIGLLAFASLLLPFSFKEGPGTVETRLQALLGTIRLPRIERHPRPRPQRRVATTGASL